MKLNKLPEGLRGRINEFLGLSHPSLQLGLRWAERVSYEPGLVDDPVHGEAWRQIGELMLVAREVLDERE